jgi:putative oxidoreductase
MLNTKQQDNLQLIARVLLSGIFLISLFSKLTGLEGTIQFMTAKGMPLPSLLIWGAIATELAGALALITGYRMKEAGIVLALYLVPTSLIFHNFWAMEGQQFQMQLMAFMKNVSIIGGLLLLTSMPGKQASPANS